MEKMNLNGQINGGAADARKNFAEIYSNIISKYYNELVEDDGRSEILVESGALDPSGVVGYKVHLRLGNKRNGYRREKQIVFLSGIVGHGSWEQANNENFYDVFMGDYFDGLLNSETANETSLINDYCRNYGFDLLMADYELYDDKTFDDEDDFVLLPMCEEPDDFYDTFGEEAKWNWNEMYEGMSAALYQITKKHWRVECDGYRVYGYIIDSDPSDDLRECEEKMGRAVGKVMADFFAA